MSERIVKVLQSYAKDIKIIEFIQSLRWVRSMNWGLNFDHPHRRLPALNPDHVPMHVVWDENGVQTILRRYLKK